MPAAMRLPMRVLVVAPNWIGDALLAQPLLARLQSRLPGVIIDALAPPWTGPVLAQKKLYLRDEALLLCLDWKKESGR